MCIALRRQRRGMLQLNSLAIRFVSKSQLSSSAKHGKPVVRRTRKPLAKPCSGESKFDWFKKNCTHFQWLALCAGSNPRFVREVERKVSTTRESPR